jgi:hypothetical protein
MESAIESIPVSKKALWTGRVLSALPVALLLLSAVMKFAQPAGVVEGFKHMGYSQGLAVPLGIVELACTVIYLVPSTSVLGAILLTGYLGGATASTLRVGDQFFPPVLVGVLVWGGLFLRDRRLRELIPLTRRA